MRAGEGCSEGMEKGKTRWGYRGRVAVNTFYVSAFLIQDVSAMCIVPYSCVCTFYLYILQIHTMYYTVNVLTTVRTTSCFVYSVHNALVTCYHVNRQ